MGVFCCISTITNQYNQNENDWGTKIYYKSDSWEVKRKKLANHYKTSLSPAGILQVMKLIDVASKEDDDSSKHGDDKSAGELALSYISGFKIIRINSAVRFFYKHKGG